KAETVRLAEVERQVRTSWNTARALLAENNPTAARHQLGDAQTKLGNDRSALAELAAEGEASPAQVGRFQRVLALVHRAHQAEAAPALAMVAMNPDKAPADSEIAGGRRPAAAVPFLLQALDCYGILDRADWTIPLEGGLLSTGQVEQLRRTAYEEL